MSENWQPGDVAICVEETKYGTIKIGNRYTVVNVHVGMQQGTGKWLEGLSLLENKP